MLLILLLLIPLIGIFMIFTVSYGPKGENNSLSFRRAWAALKQIIRIALSALYHVAVFAFYIFLFLILVLLTGIAFCLLFYDPLLLNSSCVHGIDVYTCNICNYICPHNLQVLYCNACMSMQNSLDTIAQCEHNWEAMAHTDALHDNPCDYGSPTESHSLYGNYQYHHYYCTICHSIMCSDCYTG